MTDRDAMNDLAPGTVHTPDPHRPVSPTLPERMCSPASLTVLIMCIAGGICMILAALI